MCFKLALYFLILTNENYLYNKIEIQLNNFAMEYNKYLNSNIKVYS